MLIINGVLLVIAIRHVWNFPKWLMMINFSDSKPSCSFYKWESKIYSCWVTSPNSQTKDSNKRKSHHWQWPCYQIVYKSRTCFTSNKQTKKNRKKTSPKSGPSISMYPKYLNQWFLNFSTKVTIIAEGNELVSQNSQEL